MKIVVDKDEYEELKKYKRKYSIAKNKIRELKEGDKLIGELLEEELTRSKIIGYCIYVLYGVTETDLLEKYKNGEIKSRIEEE